MSPDRTSWRIVPCLIGVALLLTTGCSTIESIQGIPSIAAHRVPPALLGRSKSDLQEISLTRLRQDPPEVYQLAPGDILGIYIANILGNPEEAPPVHFPEDSSQPPAIGFPIPVREDGTIALPLIDPLDVNGLTLAQTSDLIKKAYTVDQQLLPPGEDNIIVTLIKRRTYSVLVVREESGAVEGVTKRGTGHTVDLPAYENDLLHALNETGGLPGVDAESVVLIYRGMFKSGAERDQLLAQINAGRNPCDGPIPAPDDPNVTAIPLRYYPENYPTFTEEDIILETGDIVMIQARDSEKFYTGGVLGGGEYLLPRDYDIDILNAIAIAKGPVGTGTLGGGAASTNWNGFGRGVTIPPSKAIVLRKIPGGGQIPIRVNLNRALQDPSQRILIQPEDVVIVRHTWDEELLNIALGIVQFNFLFNGFGGGSF